MSRSRKRDVPSAAWLQQPHRRLFGEIWRWAGTFRKTEKNIGVDPTEIALQLAMLLSDAHYWSEHVTYAPLDWATGQDIQQSGGRREAYINVLRSADAGGL